MAKKLWRCYGKKLVCAALCACMTLPFFAACKKENSSDVTVLRVANWEEYMDEGGWGEDETIDLADGTKIFGDRSMVKDFEDWYYDTYHKRVKVEYSTFGTNEDLYNQMTLGDTFDLVCPSEYMIMKLMTEDAVLPFSDGFRDENNLNNFYARGVSPYIRQRLEKLDMDGKRLGDYAACYMWGVIGFVYNPEIVSREEAGDWNLLRNPAYRKRVTTKDSVRDSYFAALGMLNQEKMRSKDFKAREDYTQALDGLMNDTSEETVDRVEQILSETKENVYSFETDSGKADLVTGKVAANFQWSGDAVYSMQQAEEDGVELEFAVPDSCTNLWFDGWCMLKKGIGGDADKRHAAEAFVNFVSRPDNAIRNMYYIGYTSAIAGGESDLIYQYADWCYGAESEGENAAPAEELAEYPLGYFFSENPQDERYTLLAKKSMTKGQLYAQYPPQDVLNRSVVMAYFDREADKKIRRMWTNIRCFKLW